MSSSTSHKFHLFWKRLPLAAWLSLLALVSSGCSSGPMCDFDQDGMCYPEDCNDFDPGPCFTDPSPSPSPCPTYYVDGDGDGFGRDSTSIQTCSPEAFYVLDGGDCDDNNPSIYPGALEDSVGFCADGFDNDCDGAVDEEKRRWYRDADDDGFGDSDTWIESCIEPDGYVADGADCNDSESAVFPGAPEVCDGADSDCDGSVAEDVLTLYQDLDGDGYGNPDVSQVVCCFAAPNDSQASAPFSTKTARNGVPALYNSNGYSAGPKEQPNLQVKGAKMKIGNLTSAFASMETFERTRPRPRVRVSSSLMAGLLMAPLLMAAAEDCDGDGWTANGDVPDCNDRNASIYPGAIELCDGQDNDCDGQLPENETDVDGDGAVPCAIDADGWDGGGEIMQGEDCDDGNASVYPGASALCDGLNNDCLEPDWPEVPTSEIDQDGDGWTECEGDCNDGDGRVYPGASETRDRGDQNCNGQDEVGLDRADAIVYGNAGDAAGGQTVLMDFDGDGLEEWVVAAPQSNSGPGKICVFQDPVGTVQNILDADFCFFGVSTNDRFGLVRNVGDTNEDGQPDLCTGAYGADTNGTNSGAAYCFSSPIEEVDHFMANGDWDGRMYGAKSYDEVGARIVAAGDADGDGQDDVFFQTRSATYQDHTIYLIYGPLSVDAAIGSTPDIVIREEASGDAAMALQPCDITGDGVPEYIFFSTYHEGGKGRVYFVPGPLTSDFTLGSSGTWIDGDFAGQKAGASIECAGDINGDGYGDIMIGTTQDCIYLVPGGPNLPTGNLTDNAILSICMPSSPGWFGNTQDYGIRALDMNGDGHPDIAIMDAQSSSAPSTISVFAGPFTPGSELNAYTDADVVLYGVSNGDFGSSIAVGDVNGDGIDDLSVGAINVSGSWSGAAYLFLGAPDFFPSKR